MSGAEKARLPELRQDLRLETGAVDLNGQPTWLIVDAAQHRYIQIDPTARYILASWQAGLSFDALRDRVEAEHSLHVSDNDIRAFLSFLSDNHLTVEPASGGWQKLAAKPKANQAGWLMWLLHNYLFIRIPLLRPEPVLGRLMPFFEPVFSRTFFAIVAVLGVSGLYLVSRQWEAFLGTFPHLFTIEGVLLSLVALIIVKSAHELAHALVARRFGCAVPSMGICFIVLFPMLYTDVTDAWRLRDRRQRFLIGAAGIIVELCFAALATFVWVFLPEGILKSLAFSIATVGWILSLAVNLNPLMRFDGYYLLSDVLGVDNLQNRAFAFGQWKMREILFGFGDRPPEAVTRPIGLTLITFAWAVWLYRVVLFTAIAVLVYHMTFKVLGIILFAAEIGYFIVRPVCLELAHWWSRRKEIVSQPRMRISTLITAGVVMMLMVPWSSRVSVPAVVEAAALTYVFPQRPGEIAEVNVVVGDRVRAGEVLLTLQSAELSHREAIAARKLESVKTRLARRGADGIDLSASLVLEQELKAVDSEIAGLARERAELTVRAPHDGVVIELNSDLHPGRTMNGKEVVGLVRAVEPLIARGFIAENDLSRLTANAAGTFIPEMPGVQSFPVSLERISVAGAPSLDITELASVYGGPIAVRPKQARSDLPPTLVPVEAVYAAQLAVPEPPADISQSLRGTIVLDGAAQSIFKRVWRQVASVLIRESGF